MTNSYTLGNVQFFPVRNVRKAFELSRNDAKEVQVNVIDGVTGSVVELKNFKRFPVRRVRCFVMKFLTSGNTGLSFEITR